MAFKKKKKKDKIFCNFMKTQYSLHSLLFHYFSSSLAETKCLFLPQFAAKYL